VELVPRAPVQGAVQYLKFAGTPMLTGHYQLLRAGRSLYELALAGTFFLFGTVLQDGTYLDSP
jgi:hypothetical protein